MAFCVKCGKEIEEGNVVCFECAAAELPAQPEAAPVNNQPYGQQPYAQPYNPYGMPMPEDVTEFIYTLSKNGSAVVTK